MKREIFLLVVFLAVLLASCGPGPYAIERATLRDTIFSIEPRSNGTTTLWMTHDDVGAYCTRDSALVAQANALLAQPAPYNEVLVTYRSINNSDSEWQWFGVGEGCARDSTTTIYRIISLTAVNTQEGGD